MISSLKRGPTTLCNRLFIVYSLRSVRFQKRHHLALQLRQKGDF